MQKGPHPRMRIAALVSSVVAVAISLAGCAAQDAADDSGETDDAIRVGRANPAVGQTLRVKDGDLYDRCGEKVMLRGVNKDIVALDRQGNSVSEVAKTGANTIRMVWLSTIAPAEAEAPISKAVNSGLFPILELHDATGNINRVGAMVSYWTRSDMVRLIQKYQNDLIINIANEAGDGDVSDAAYISTYTSAVTRMRSAGIHVPLIVDAAQWGQGVEQLLRVATKVESADPDKNVIFSWHEYSGGDSEYARITNAFQSARNAKIPLIVGEFAQVGWDCAWNVPYWHILSEAQRLGIGWLAWSWDNSNGACASAGWSGYNMTGDGVHLASLNNGWPRDVVYNQAASLSKTSKRTNWQQKRQCK